MSSGKDFLNMTQEILTMKQIIDTLSYTEIEKFCFTEDITKRVKRQLT